MPAKAGVASTQAGVLVDKRQLAEGLQVSEVIKGCWQLSGGHKGEPGDDRTSGSPAVADFQRFVDAGVTTFDTADIYGPSEKLIGEFVKKRGGTQGLQLLTKSCKFGGDMRDVSQRAISKGIARSLDNMHASAVDLVQFYWHDYGTKNYVTAAQRLQEEVGSGRVRNLGVTNFDTQRIDEMCAGGAQIVSSQVQYSLLDRRPENKMVPYCQAHGMTLTPYGTVAGGFLSERYLGVTASEIRTNTYSKGKYAAVIKQSGGWQWFQRLLQSLDGVAQKHGSSIANVACRWVLDKPTVAGIIVGARNAQHVADHQQLMSLYLDVADREAIDSVLAEGKQAQGDCYDWERGGRW